MAHEKINITERLRKMVMQRKTPIIETKRVIGHKPSRARNGDFSSDGYSYGYD
jgi:hypothetical protein